MQAGCLLGTDILVGQLGRVSSRPKAKLESPANRQAGKPAPLLFDANSQIFNKALLLDCPFG
jgi:hypothetical protein